MNQHQCEIIQFPNLSAPAQWERLRVAILAAQIERTPATLRLVEQERRALVAVMRRAK